ncbi:MAG TPA: acyltransferase [Acidimicrobiales bacterium]|nr:acyltransferase [Acidimicrobiales bacterium]
MKRLTLSESTFFAHELAVVEPGAVVGKGTQIWHHAHVRSGAVIGRGGTVGKGVYVDDGAIIGDEVKLQNHVCVYKGVTIESRVFVGPNATFTNDLFPRAVNEEWVVVPTTVREGASIGAGAVVVCGHEIGAYAMVGSGSVVTRDVEPHELVVGNPARRLGWVCTCGRLVARTQDRPDDLRCDGCREAEA